MSQTDYARERRNVNPHAEAKLAMMIWGAEYGPQRLGCMDWWDGLDEARKKRVRATLNEITGLPREVSKTQDAVGRLAAMLALPSVPGGDEPYSEGECFEPWAMFPALCGSYSSEFDHMAIEVLEDIQARTFARSDLASEMFREMLCTTGLCTYGTSPRTCFAEAGFAPLLPRLIERWKEYADLKWRSEQETRGD